MPSPGAREVSLAGGATIDLSTWDTTHERSRLPVDAYSGAVDILINQAGQVIPNTYYSTPSSVQMAAAFYHFWITDREGCLHIGHEHATSRVQLPLASNLQQLRGNDAHGGSLFDDVPQV